MRIEDTVRECVVFLGFEHHSPEAGGIHCIGTAFLLAYKNGGYLVTAKHVAKEFGDNPFLIRLNKTDGTSQNIPADEIIWHYHPDENVDVAVIPFEVPNLINNRIYEVTYFSDNMVLTDDILKRIYVGIGDQCYTIGLFRLLAGKDRNLPIVHTGNIALMPSDEKIPALDWDDPNKKRYIEGYLVESQSLEGLSGSPVMVRLSIDMDIPVEHPELPAIKEMRVRIPSFHVFLLGIWQGSWRAEPSEFWGLDQGKTVVPVGMGVVIPASRIIEVLDMPELSEKRRTRKSSLHIEYVTQPDGVHIIEENPQHKEDFNSLLTAAVKKKPPADET